MNIVQRVHKKVRIDLIAEIFQPIAQIFLFKFLQSAFLRIITLIVFNPDINSDKQQRHNHLKHSGIDGFHSVRAFVHSVFRIMIRIQSAGFLRRHYP